jgi:hypothetical protein
MTTAILRKELQDCIAAMPEQSLYALKPLFSLLSGPKYIIEPADAEEAAMIDGRMKDYYADPSSFVHLESIG